VARVKLNHSRINSILTSAKAQFEPDGNLFKGLLKIVKDFRLAFVCTFQSVVIQCSTVKLKRLALAVHSSETEASIA
jgi:hypothetical protein